MYKSAFFGDREFNFHHINFTFRNKELFVKEVSHNSEYPWKTLKNLQKYVSKLCV